MVAERKIVDIEDIPEVEALTRELDEHPEGLVLRRGGRQIAVLSMLPDVHLAQNTGGPKWKTMTPEEREMFRSLAGAWVGMLDFDQLDQDRAAQREESLRLDEARRRRLGLEGSSKP